MKKETVIILAICALCAVWIFNISPDKDSSPYGDWGKQQVWIVVTQDHVKSRLRDPDSAKFRNVAFRVFDKLEKGPVPVVCGEVSSKNGYGGYSGYQGFIGSGKVLLYLEKDFAAGEFATSWNLMCKG